MSNAGGIFPNGFNLANIQAAAANYASTQYMPAHQTIYSTQPSCCKDSPSSPVTGPSSVNLSHYPLNCCYPIKDSRWLTLEICREHLKNKCQRMDSECKYAHPPKYQTLEIHNGRVICCYDYIKGKCNRKSPPCKYLHPPNHLKEQLLQNGRNNLIIKNLYGNFLRKQLHNNSVGTHGLQGNGNHGNNTTNLVNSNTNECSIRNSHNNNHNNNANALLASVSSAPMYNNQLPLQINVSNIYPNQNSQYQTSPPILSNQPNLLPLLYPTNSLPALLPTQHTLTDAAALSMATLTNTGDHTLIPGFVIHPFPPSQYTEICPSFLVSQNLTQI